MGTREKSTEQYEGTQRIGTTDQSKRFAAQYAQWARKLETWMIANHKNVITNNHKYIGRARIPRMVKKPLMDKPRLHPGAFKIPGGLGIVERLLYTMTNLMTRARIYKEKGKELEVTQTICEIMAPIEAETPDLRAAWETIHRPDCITTMIAAGIKVIEDADIGRTEIADKNDRERNQE